MSISPRRFDGWEPRQHFRPDGAGGWLVTREPEWDAEDRAFLYALDEYEADLCPGCGQPMSESLHVIGEKDPQYEVNFAVCVGCEVRERAMKKVDQIDQEREKQGAAVFRAARRWMLKRR